MNVYLWIKACIIIDTKFILESGGYYVVHHEVELGQVDILVACESLFC